MGQLEKTPTTNQLHWQIYFELKKRSYATAINKIFPSGQWSTVVAKGTAEQNRKYTGKEATAQLDDDKQPTHFEEGSFALAGKANALQEMEMHVKAGKREKFLWENYFATMVVHNRGLRRAIDVLNTPNDKALFDKDKFPWTEEVKIDWTYTQVFWGKSGIGKTQWAMSLIDKPLLVSHMDQLSGFEPNEHGGIIFDDVTFMGDPITKKGRWKDEAQIHIADQDNTRAIHIRYEVGLIPAHTKKIITTNVEGGWVLDWDLPAVKRRASST